MLRCLIPATSCVLDVAFALNGAATTQDSLIGPAVMLAIAAAGSIPLVIHLSRRIVGLDLAVERTSSRHNA